MYIPDNCGHPIEWAIQYIKDKMPGRTHLNERHATDMVAAWDKKVSFATKIEEVEIPDEPKASTSPSIDLGPFKGFTTGV